MTAITNYKIYFKKYIFHYIMKIKYPEINLSKKVWLYKERNLMKQREAHTWFNEDIDCSWRKITIVWWTLQQHRFEMGESTYTGIFFNSIYHSTTHFSVEFTDAESQIWRNHRYEEPSINYRQISTVQKVGTLNALFKGKL